MNKGHSIKFAILKGNADRLNSDGLKQLDFFNKLEAQEFDNRRRNIHAQFKTPNIKGGLTKSQHIKNQVISLLMDKKISFKHYQKTLNAVNFGRMNCIPKVVRNLLY